ncbi:MAG: GTPase ObgE [Nitrospirota bacterium]|nr:GTPase ObgE [Nitrospirota bacterium]
MSLFIDHVRVFVSSGDGGKGCVAFHREKYVPKGGPDGGDGGRGGDVILVADRTLSTLAELRYRKRYEASNGAPGSGNQKTGRDGATLRVRVPAGTVVKDEESGEILADLVRDGQEFLAARGGKGGLGNQHFATPSRQVPRYAQPGLPGESLWLTMELKLLADVGLVGFPNAGKSTLIARISAARPKIADYPFTTLTPNLGVVTWDDYQSFVVADIPGLIEGAHDGKGLGTRFLRHIERTRYLLMMADCTAMADPEPQQALDILRRELLAYDAHLATRPFCVAATKADAADDERLEAVHAWAKQAGAPCFTISAVSGAGITELVRHLGDTVGRMKAQEPEPEVTEAPDPVWDDA